MGGLGVPSQKIWNLVHFGDGHYLLPITYLLFIQINRLHPDLQGLDKLTLNIQTYFMAIPPAIAI